MKARKIFVITISLVSSILSVGCSSHQTKKSHEKPVKQEASMRIRGMVKMLDTVKSIDQNSIQINQNVFEGLFAMIKKVTWSWPERKARKQKMEGGSTSTD